MVDLSKRRFLKQGIYGLHVCGVGAIWANTLVGCSHIDENTSVALRPADNNGVRLPEGFTARIVAVSGKPVTESGYRWHPAPDGGACFSADNGGWIYVSNSEMYRHGGVGAIVFDQHGNVIDGYSILEGTRRNCAGGATPWGTWLSCEEIDDGQVWECYPDGSKPAVLRPALGTFAHEAVTVEEKSGWLYLTEDKPDSCLYRFIANRNTGSGYPDLNSGRLQVAVRHTQEKDIHNQDSRIFLDWHNLPDPLAKQEATRYQLSSAMRFDGGEGITSYDGKVVFTTKGDDRVWSYDTSSNELQVLYDADDSLTPILTGVDNITVSKSGEYYVAEDGGDLQIVAITRQGKLYPVVQLEGHDKSEITGPAFSPDGRRLYFSSQRGTSGRSDDGVTFEISGF